MTRVRIVGPRERLDATLRTLQDAEVVHVVRPSVPDLHPSPMPREDRALRRIVADVDAALRALGAVGRERPTAPIEPVTAPLPRAVLRAGRVRRKAERLALAIEGLQEEQALLLRYEEFFHAFEPFLAEEQASPDRRAFYVILRAGATDVVGKLTNSLESAVGGEIEVVARPLATGESAVLLLSGQAVAGRVGQLLSGARVDELPVPAILGESTLARGMPALRARLAAIVGELADLESQRRALRETEAPWLRGVCAKIHDRLLVLEARGQAHEGHHVFVIEGWVPRPQLPALVARAARELGPEVLVEDVATEPWMRSDAPVALANPPLFRPFEVITRTLPLPRYGTIDPTPFVAVFFPMFFGLMLADVGYGCLVAVCALLLRLGSKPGSTRRSIAAVAGACAVFIVGFGFAAGELFGDLGRRVLGMSRHGLDREHAVVPFLALTAALGLVHVLLGLVLGSINAWRYGDRRHALGRGVAALMVALTAMAILLALKVLPSALFTPVVIGLLVAFPALVLLEGVVAVIELLGNFGQILSYVRIMALGTASLMLAVVANGMVGMMGSLLVGTLFALLFHLINFTIGMFSPTIHALRLHYVEFFGRFFSPGGTAYRPLAHWHPLEAGEPRGAAR